MPDPRIERLAEVLVRYSVDVQPGQLVVVEGSSVAGDLIRSLCRSVLAAGGHPEVRVGIDGLRELLLTEGSDAQLDWLVPRSLDDVKLADARIQILAETNTRSLSAVDPTRQARLSRSREPIRRTVFDRTHAGEYRWVITGFPTHAAAQEAHMSLAGYTEFVYGAALLDDDDPIAVWKAIGERIGKLADWLGTVRELRITGPGTDLTFGVEGRTWISCDGTFNFPDGECFTAPVEDSAEGVISFTYPAIFQGRAIEGVRLRFRGGEVVEATASRGQDFLEEMLSLDDGARRIGEFSFGLNEAVRVFTGETLFDEKMGGTVHLALGESYPESGGVNRSALHWDMVSDLRRGSEAHADGEVIYRDGRFLNGRF